MAFLKGPSRLIPSLRGQSDNVLGQPTQYVNKILRYDPLVLFPQNEGTGTVITELVNGWNWVYSGPQWGLGTFLDGSPVPFYDGLLDFGNIYTAALASAFNGAAGTVMIWAKVYNAGVWTDGATRRILCLLADINNYVILDRTTTNNQLRFLYTAGGITETVTTTSIGGATGWFSIVITWDKAAGVDGEVLAYINGAQVGTTQTSLGIWAGSISSSFTLIGARTQTPTNPFHGYLGPCAIWTSALTSTQIADLYVV